MITGVKIKNNTILSKRPEHSLDDFYRKRKRVLIKRDFGGLGDVLMHRMIFEDFKLLMPDAHITFACPAQYMEAVVDHPYVDEVTDCKRVDPEDYIIYYNTSACCRRYELMTSPYCDKHRSDIWAEHCGVTLTRHNMHIRLTEEEKEWGRDKIGAKKSVLLAPISAMVAKNLEVHQGQPVIDELERRGYHVFILHNREVPQFRCRCIYGVNLRQWMALIDSVDYVISVDTSVFHCAGGMGKRVVGVFGWADLKVYGRYYPNVSAVQRHRDYTPGWTCGPCYNFGDCVKSKEERKPCITEITYQDILEGFERCLK